MKFDIAKRQSGKTTRLIMESVRTGATIVCPTMKMAKFVKQKARNMMVDIPEPIIFRTFIERYLSNYCHGDHQNGQGYLIDELQICLAQMNVKVATIDSTHVDVCKES